MKTSFTFARLFVVTAGLALLQLPALAQGQVRPVGSFERLQASGAVNVFLKQGPTAEVRLEGDPQVLERIRTEVEGGTLKVYRVQRKGVSLGNWKAERVSVYITTPRLSGLEVSGASDVKGQTPFTADDFTLRVSGASDATLDLTAKTLKAAVSGASDLRLTGRVERQQVSVSGASDYRAYNLRSQQADVQASGASDAQVYVDGDLAMRSSGASDVHYKGKARMVR